MQHAIPGRQDILIAGGYGVIGGRIAKRLAALFPDRVIVAGRDRGKASAFAADVGNGLRARHIDVDDLSTFDESLSGVGVIVASVTQRNPTLLEAAVARGLAYTDTTPRLAFWKGVDGLATRARISGARVVLGAGLSPGFSNMMAARLAAPCARVDSVETSIFLGAGDRYGDDSLNHLIESLTQTFALETNGVVRETCAFNEYQRVAFPLPIGERKAYLFPWSDVVNYPQTLRCHTAQGYLALDPPALANAVAWLVRHGRSDWLRLAKKRKGLVSILRATASRLTRPGIARDHYSLKVSVTSGECTTYMGLVGRGQADLTAASATQFVRELVDPSTIPVGVWYPEQVINADRFLRAMADEGWVTVTGCSTGSATTSQSDR
jgi:short subunit dehydrogenase-like uncharacterized protein